MTFVFAYLVIRQARIVARLHSSVERVDLLRPEPLHAMARLTARSAIALVVFAIYAGLPLSTNTGDVWVQNVITFSGPLLLLGLLAFFVPLRGFNRRLVSERNRLLNETNMRIEETSGALHELVDRESANVTDADASRLAQTRMDALTKALSGLLQERDFIKKLSTWPWDPTTFRTVISALALPIVIFLITRFLDRVI
jgi:hypothetical protein